MGLYIKGLKMPKDNCEVIRQITITNNWIDGKIKMLAHDSVTNEFIGEVIEVTESHGRIIDADAAIRDFANYNIDHMWDANDLPYIMEECETVIEVEGE